MDDLSLKVIALLRKNARFSQTELAKLTGAHRNTISRCIEILERDGIIEGYTVKLKRDPTKIRIFMLIKMVINQSHAVSSIEKLLKNSDHINQYYRLKGQYSYICTITTDDTDCINEIIENISAINGVYTEMLSCI